LIALPGAASQALGGTLPERAPPQIPQEVPLPQAVLREAFGGARTLSQGRQNDLPGRERGLQLGFQGQGGLQLLVHEGDPEQAVRIPVQRWRPELDPAAQLALEVGTQTLGLLDAHHAGGGGRIREPGGQGGQLRILITGEVDECAARRFQRMERARQQ
jgi:hypothetical protein